MKSESQSSFEADNADRDRLDACLKSWKVEAGLPQHAVEAVWRRVRTLEGIELPLRSILYALISRVFTALSQPRWACVCIVCFLVLGMCSGWVSARMETQRVKHALSERYFSMFGPDHFQP